MSQTISDTIGLARGTVKLTPHDPSWQQRFEVEADMLRQKLNIADVQHIGSTSIPGILAKPIIDIALLVESLSVVDDWIESLAELGYHSRPETVSGRRFFAKGPPENRTVYLHIVNNREFQRLITFRDTLRAKPALAKEYSDLKATLAISLADDRVTYTKQKNDFIARILN